MNKIIKNTILAALLTIIASCSEEQKTVHVYNWSDYIDESILADFENETGIKVIYDVFDSNEVLESKLLTGNTGYDVVVPTATFLSRQIKAGVFQPLDKAKLPNITNMWQTITARTEKYDPAQTHSINYMWGTTGIGYNVEKARQIIGGPVRSWNVIFDPEIIAEFAECGVYILDAQEEVIPAALNYLGLDPNSKNLSDIQQAEQLLATIAPHVQKFHSSEYINALANGDICLALGWSGDVFQARDRAAEADAGFSVDFAIPNEGALMWFDQMAIPADAKNVDAAHQFINYIMKPEVIAKASNYVYFANGNEASQPLLEDDVLQDPAIYPDAATLQKLYTTTPYDAELQSSITRIWTRIKTGQ